MSGSVGILGGTFNPPHIGHLVLAQEAHWLLGLERVVFMPAGKPPHREVEQGVAAELRYEMCLRAVGGDERFSVSRHEVEKAGPAYTSETLAELTADPGGELAGCDLVWLIGGDEAHDLPDWHEPRRVLELARLAVAERDRHRRQAIADRLAPLGAPDRVTFLEMPRIEISSTLVRERVAAGQPIDYLVPAVVAAYIRGKDLYGTAKQAGGAAKPAGGATEGNPR